MITRPLAAAGICSALVAAVLALAGSTSAEVLQRDNLRVAFSGKIAPKRLPRGEAAPIEASLSGRITTTDATTPPQLQEIEVAINREGRFDYRGLPTCRLEQIQPATTANALAACGEAKVGEGHFEADVAIPGQAPFPSNGRLVAFNGVENGRHVIFAHVYGTDPLPTSYTVAFRISRSHGTFATILKASLPKVTGNAGFVTGLELSLGRRFAYRGQRRSYLSAPCPAPAGFTRAVFPLLRVRFGFADGRSLGSVLPSDCRVAAR
jgi:hypothetical protein